MSPFLCIVRFSKFFVKIEQILIEQETRRTSSRVLPASSFLLALASPVLHRMLCGSFIESNEKDLRLNDVDIGTFVKTLDIWCGRAGSNEMELYEVQELASVAFPAQA